MVLPVALVVFLLVVLAVGLEVDLAVRPCMLDFDFGCEDFLDSISKGLKIGSGDLGGVLERLVALEDCCFWREFWDFWGLYSGSVSSCGC